jgi:hypothetical protein
MLSACTLSRSDKPVAGTPPPQQPNVAYDAANKPMHAEPMYREQQKG